MNLKESFIIYYIINYNNYRDAFNILVYSGNKSEMEIHILCFVNWRLQKDLQYSSTETQGLIISKEYRSKVAFIGRHILWYFQGKRTYSDG